MSVWEDMKVMCDTNIILDVLLDQEPFAEASAKVLSLFEAGTLETPAK